MGLLRGRTFACVAHRFRLGILDPWGVSVDVVISGMGFQFTHDAIGEPSERSDGRSVVERNSLRSSSLVLSALSRNTFASPLYGWSKASSMGT